MEGNIFFALMAAALWPLSSCITHQYYFVNMGMSWTEAQSYCRQNYTDLATIDTTEEMTSLFSTIAPGYTGPAWIGLYDSRDVNSWLWSLDGRSLYGAGGTVFTNWDVGEPSSDLGKNCVMMLKTGKWQTQNCIYGWYFVCYDGKVQDSQSYVNISYWKSWPEAQSYCRANYTDLTSVRNQSENNAVLSLIPYGRSVWIGLYRDSWRWSDGDNSTFRYWKTTEPNNPTGNASCAVQWFSGEHKWGTASCTTKYPFFCYKANRTTTPSPTTASTAPSTTNSTTEQVTTTQTTTHSSTTHSTSLTQTSATSKVTTAGTSTTKSTTGTPSTLLTVIQTSAIDPATVQPSPAATQEPSIINKTITSLSESATVYDNVSYIPRYSSGALPPYLSRALLFLPPVLFTFTILQ